MVKDILRHAVGVFFLFSFLLFLLLCAVRFELLVPRFWTTSLSKSGMYRELVSKVGSLQQQIDASMGKGQFQLEGIITEERVQPAIEENITRLLAYLQGKSAELLLFFPLSDWGLPPSLLAQPSFKNITANTKLADAVAVLGMKPEAAQQIEVTLTTLQKYMRFLPIVWGVLFIVVLGLGVLYMFIGNRADRLSHLGFLFTLVGLVAGLIGLVGSDVAVIGVRGVQGSPPWVREFIVQVAGQFFSLGKIIGFVVFGIGIIVWVASKKLGEKKEKAAKQGLVPRVLKFVAGVTLGLIIVAAPLIVLVVVISGKLNGRVGNTTSGAKVSDGIYISKLGWSMTPPAGWQVKEDPKFVVFAKISDSTKIRAYIQVKAVQRYSEVDGGTYLATARQGLVNGNGGISGIVFVQEPREDVWNGWKRFILFIDYKDKSLGSIRTIRWDMFPQGSGNGWSLSAQMPKENWDMYGKAVEGSFVTFKVQ